MARPAEGHLAKHFTGLHIADRLIVAAGEREGAAAAVDDHVRSITHVPFTNDELTRLEHFARQVQTATQKLRTAC